MQISYSGRFTHITLSIHILGPILILEALFPICVRVCIVACLSICAFVYRYMYVYLRLRIYNVHISISLHHLSTLKDQGSVPGELWCQLLLGVQQLLRLYWPTQEWHSCMLRLDSNMFTLWRYCVFHSSVTSFSLFPLTPSLWVVLVFSMDDHQRLLPISACPANILATEDEGHAYAFMPESVLHKGSRRGSSHLA